ncbi:MAG TPA: site-specific integrase [Candidatus Paceibacterota bacterium]|nr:site-specific integrase [Verrucomicrobiota bacterium]HSA12268.1 site-specific integrase [Candidatus Paceibacterota bacterium]
MGHPKVEFEKVKDKRGKRIRGLWQRGEVFYAQLRVTNPTTGKRRPQKLALEKTVTTIPQALQALAEMRAKERRGELRGRTGVPTFGEYKKYYLTHAQKDKHTMDNETSFLNAWEGYFGSDMRLDKISEASIRQFLRREANRISERTGRPLSNHSLNVRVYALRSMLRMAKEERKIVRLPFEGIKKLKHEAEKKQVPPVEEIEKCVTAAIDQCPKSGKQFADYLRLLMYTGARETEALSLQWGDINFEKRQVHFHRNTKFGKERWLDFNPKLAAHLKDMQARRKQENEWLFPSPRPNLQGGRITNFRRTLEKAREQAGVYLSEHYLRHYFASQCVMAGVDRFTLVGWLGHADGGKLIAKTYGHLDNAFQQKQAEKVTNL